MATELTGYGNQLRMFGGGNTYFNTADLVEFEMQVLDMELNPLRDRKDKATVEKNAWTDFRNSLQDKLVDLDTIRFYDMVFI